MGNFSHFGFLTRVQVNFRIILFIAGKNKLFCPHFFQDPMRESHLV